jgi:hypothetical protein
MRSRRGRQGLGFREGGREREREFMRSYLQDCCCAFCDGDHCLCDCLVFVFFGGGHRTCRAMRQDCCISSMGVYSADLTDVSLALMPFASTSPSVAKCLSLQRGREGWGGQGRVALHILLVLGLVLQRLESSRTRPVSARLLWMNFKATPAGTLSHRRECARVRTPARIPAR